MNFLLFVSIVSHHLILSVVADYTTADGWTFSNETKNFYQIFSKNLTFANTAKTFCHDKNSNLAAIKSNTEFVWFQNFINQNSNKNHVWVFIF